MLDWFKRKSREQSLSNIVEGLRSLIDACDRADETIRRVGECDPRTRRTIRKLQSALMIQLAGPLPLHRVRRDFIDPALKRPEVSDSARMAVRHVCDSVAAQNLTWPDDDHVAYEELVRAKGLRLRDAGET